MDVLFLNLKLAFEFCRLLNKARFVRGKGRVVGTNAVANERRESALRGDFEVRVMCVTVCPGFWGRNHARASASSTPAKFSGFVLVKLACVYTSCSCLETMRSVCFDNTTWRRAPKQIDRSSTWINYILSYFCSPLSFCSTSVFTVWVLPQRNVVFAINQGPKDVFTEFVFLT